MKLFLLFCVPSLLIAFTACKSSRTGYESAMYQSLKQDGPFELREYPDLAVAETPMDGDSGSSFQRLFRYISGKNSRDEKIAMTTPVFMGGTTPGRTMAFVMPADLQDAAPPPRDSRVRLAKIPGGRYAVMRFSGSRSEESEQKSLKLLRAWMASNGLETTSAPLFAYFDPPWTPSFLRRNEVMMLIDSSR